MVEVSTTAPTRRHRCLKLLFSLLWEADADGPEEGLFQNGSPAKKNLSTKEVRDRFQFVEEYY